MTLMTDTNNDDDDDLENPQTTFYCTFCNESSVELLQLIHEINQSTSSFESLEDTVKITRATLSQLKSNLNQDSMLTEILNATKELNDFLTIKQIDIDSFIEYIIQLDNYRHPTTLTFFSLPLAILLLIIIGKLLSKERIFYLSFHLFFIILLISWLVLAITLPLTLLFGDVCEFASSIEANLTQLALSTDAETLITACLTNENIVYSLNLSETFNFASVVEFPNDVFNSSQLIDYQTIDHYHHQINQINYTTFNFNQSLINFNELADILQFYQVNESETAYYVHPEHIYDVNVSLICEQQSIESNHSQCQHDIRQIRNPLITLIQTQDYLNHSISYIQSNMSQVMEKSQQIEIIFDSIAQDLVDMEQDLQTLLLAGSAFANNSVCSLGTSYESFKSSFCDTLTTAILYSTLSLLVIGILSFPLIIFFYQESKRIEHIYITREQAAQKIQHIWRKKRTSMLTMLDTQQHLEQQQQQQQQQQVIELYTINDNNSLNNNFTSNTSTLLKEQDQRHMAATAIQRQFRASKGYIYTDTAAYVTMPSTIETFSKK